MKRRGLWLRLWLSLDRAFYKLANLILGIFGYGYFRGRYSWGGKVIRVPASGESMDISSNTMIVVCRKDGQWGKGAALRLVTSGKSNSMLEKVAFRHTLFGGIDFIKYWDFGKFAFEKKEKECSSQ